MDFVKLKEKQKKSREKSYKLSEEQAEEQIFSLVERYDIDLSFDIDGILDEEFQKELAQMSDEEKQGGNGMKTIFRDVGNWIRKGVLSIEKNSKGDLVIKHKLLSPIGEKSESSTPIVEFIYESVKPKHTERMSGLSEKKYTFSQKAELLMSYLAGQNINTFNKLEVLDKRAARDIGILLIIAQ